MASSTNDARLDSSLLLLLERTREVYGYIPEHALIGLADALGLPVVDVYSAATFYRGLPLRPHGKHVIRVCKSVPCYLKHNGSIIHAVERELGIGPGQTSQDGLFSLELVNCIGACDRAPAMMIDDEVFGDLTAERVTEILAGYR
ncbi:MAG: NAD(P)H-dependent oxidoreductase subunit E [Dehalococcoidia bacterium]|nr:NAD(P)H-dependent oxidoreductase subunit E [Dehalococcoidia bacterium]